MRCRQARKNNPDDRSAFTDLSSPIQNGESEAPCELIVIVFSVVDMNKPSVPQLMARTHQWGLDLSALAYFIELV